MNLIILETGLDYYIEGRQILRDLINKFCQPLSGDPIFFLNNGRIKVKHCDKAEEVLLVIDPSGQQVKSLLNKHAKSKKVFVAIHYHGELNELGLKSATKVISYSHEINLPFWGTFSKFVMAYLNNDLVAISAIHNQLVKIIEKKTAGVCKKITKTVR